MSKDIYVEVNGTETLLHGISKKDLKDITRRVYNKRVADSIFGAMEDHSLVVLVDTFFLLEIAYILEKAGTLANEDAEIDLRSCSDLLWSIRSSTWVGNADKNVRDRLDLKRLKNLTMRPLPFQMEMLVKYSKLHNRYGLTGMLLAATAGSGKTFTTLALAECLNADNVIVVCPKNAVVNVWVDNIQKSYKIKQEYWSSVSSNRYAGQKFIVVHYEYLDNFLPIAKKLSDKKTIVILDESHNLNEITAIRTDLFGDMCDKLKTQDVIYASGTSVKAISLELVPILRRIDPLFTESVELKFIKLYKGEAKYWTEMLTNRLTLTSHKVEKHQLNLVAPKFYTDKVKTPNGDSFKLSVIKLDIEKYVKERKVFYAGMKDEVDKFIHYCFDSYQKNLSINASENKLKRISASHRRYLKNLAIVLAATAKGGFFMGIADQLKFCSEYEKRIIAPNLDTKEIREKFMDWKSIYKYPMLKIRGEALGRILGKKRIEATMELSGYINYLKIMRSTVKKTIVFTTYVDVVESIGKKLIEQKREPIVVHGSSETGLDEAVRAFKQDKERNPLIATYALLSTAVPLTEANVMILVNAPFRDYLLQQSVSRVNRLGQDSPTYIHIPVIDTDAEPNITTRNVDILSWSQDQVEQILGMESPFKITLESMQYTRESHSLVTILAEILEDEGIGILKYLY